MAAIDDCTFGNVCCSTRDQCQHDKEYAKRWVGTQCYLDGKPAIIAGRLNRFATVAALDGSTKYEWSWEAVDRIMRGKMEFFS